VPYIHHLYILSLWLSKFTYLSLLLFAAYPGQQRDIEYSGWTSAYSVQSILIQLQAFLMDGAFHYYKIREEDYPEKWWQKWHNAWLASTVWQARRHRCKWCGHLGGQPYPEYVSPKVLSKPKAALIQYRLRASKSVNIKKEKAKMLMTQLKPDFTTRGTPAAGIVPPKDDEKKIDLGDAPEGKARERPIRRLEVERKSSGSDGSEASDELDGEGYIQVEGEGHDEGKGERTEGQSEAELQATVDANIKEMEEKKAEDDAFWARKRAEAKRIEDEAKAKARAEKKAAKKATTAAGGVEPGQVVSWTPPKLTSAQEQRCKGAEFKGIVTKVENFGAFIDIGWRKPGLVYIAELGEPGRVEKCQDVLTVGDQVLCRVIKLDKENGKLSLTMKECRRVLKQKKLEEKKLLTSATANLAATKAERAAAQALAADKRAASLTVAFEKKAVEDAAAAKRAKVMADYGLQLSLDAGEPLEKKEDLKANGGNVSGAFVEANREAKRKERADEKEMKRVSKLATALDDGRGEGEAATAEDEPGLIARARAAGVQLDQWGRKSPKDLAVDQLVLGVVKAIHYMGAFVDIGCGKDGLLHILTMQKAYKPRHIWEAGDVLRKGQKIVCRITQIKFVPPSDDETEETVLIRLDIVLTPVDQLENKKRAYKSDGNFAMVKVDEAIIKARERLAFRKGALRLCPPECLRRVMSFLDVDSLKCTAASCDALRRIIDEAVASYWTKQELVCFHSKQTFEDDTLGLPLSVEYYDNGEVAYVHPHLDLLSKSAFFVEKVRRSVWKQPFTHWLPLYFNKRHSRNLIYHERQIAELCHNKTDRSKPKFNPLQVLKILPALLNTMVVNVMNGSTHASLLALTGYTSYYQLLLAFMSKYPDLQASANRRVKRFMKSELYRKKRHCPSLGEWLIIVSVSSFRWEEVAASYLKENFDRNVKWVCEKHPELVNVTFMKPVVNIDPVTEKILQKYDVFEPEKFGDRCKSYRAREEEKQAASVALVQSFDSARLPKTFHATIVSIRLLLFHVYFLRTFRPCDSVGDVIPLPQALARLGVCYGRPSQALQESFQTEIKKIRKVGNWHQFFWRLGLPTPRDDYLVDWLQTAVKNSARKKYHDASKFKLLELSKKEARLAAQRERYRKMQEEQEYDGDYNDAADAMDDLMAARGGKDSRYSY
jgi:predicted RNA-binding protein with RPS1 domain